MASNNPDELDGGRGLYPAAVNPRESRTENPEEKEKLRLALSARWQAVEAFRARELAAMTDERAFQIIKSLQPLGDVPPNPLNGNGLVEQQAIFHRSRK